MEDKDLEPNFEAMFTTRGQSTCYHPNGLIWCVPFNTCHENHIHRSTVAVFCCYCMSILELWPTCVWKLDLSFGVCVCVWRVNLTQLGGSCCSETGALRRRWTWLDLEPHIQAPPFQPICLVLGSHVSLRIQSQERIYLTFSSHQSRVRFNVGSKLKVSRHRTVSSKHILMNFSVVHWLMDFQG